MTPKGESQAQHRTRGTRGTRGARAARGATGSGRPGSSGRYTPPIPKEQRKSPAWVGVLLLALLVLGLLLIVLNYVGVLPSGTHNYYLVAGIVAIIAGLVMATTYH